MSPNGYMHIRSAIYTMFGLFFFTTVQRPSKLTAKCFYRIAYFVFQYHSTVIFVYGSTYYLYCIAYFGFQYHSTVIFVYGSTYYLYQYGVLYVVFPYLSMATFIYEIPCYSSDVLYFVLSFSTAQRSYPSTEHRNILEIFLPYFIFSSTPAQRSCLPTECGVVCVVFVRYLPVPLKSHIHLPSTV